MGLLQDAVVLQLSFGLALGVPMILAGLRLFKLWLAIVGFFTGVFLGVLLGGALATVMALRGDEFFVAVALIALLGGVTGAVLAWPLQRLFVFVAAGGLAAITALAGAIVLGIGGEGLLLLALIAFFGGGALSVWAYEYFIIISLASGGASSLFHAYFGRFGALQGMASLDDILHLISSYLWQYTLIMGASIAFAIYIQKWSQPASYLSVQARTQSALLKRSAFLFGGLLVASYFAQVVFPEALVVTMLGPLAWMALALLLPPLMRFTEEFSDRTGLPVPAARYGLYALIAVFVSPALAWAQDLFLYGNPANPFIYVSHGFTDGMGTLKALYAFVLFPTLGLMVMPSSVVGASSKKTVSSAAPPRPSSTADSEPMRKGISSAPEAPSSDSQVESPRVSVREPDGRIPPRVAVALPPGPSIGQGPVPSANMPSKAEGWISGDSRPLNPSEPHPSGQAEGPEDRRMPRESVVASKADTPPSPGIIAWPEWPVDSVNESRPARTGSNPPQSQPEWTTKSEQVPKRRQSPKEDTSRRLEWPE